MSSQIVINISERDFLDMSHGLNSLYEGLSLPALDFYRAAIMKLILDHFSHLNTSLSSLMRPFIPLPATDDGLSLHLPFTDQELEAIKDKTGTDIAAVSPSALSAALMKAFEQSGLLRIQVANLPLDALLTEGRSKLKISHHWGCYMIVQLLDTDTGHWMPCPPKPFLGLGISVSG